MTTSFKTRRLVGALVALPVASSLRKIMHRNRLLNVSAVWPEKTRINMNENWMISDVEQYGSYPLAHWSLVLQSYRIRRAWENPNFPNERPLPEAPIAISITNKRWWHEIATISPMSSISSRLPEITSWRRGEFRRHPGRWWSRFYRWDRPCLRGTTWACRASCWIPDGC